MTCLEWSRQTSALREGKLRLEPPEEDGLSQFARRSLWDLREYLAALEHGYRKVCLDLDQYRKQERVRGGMRLGGKTLEELLSHQWSESACLGYAKLGLQAAGFRPDEIVCVLEAMEEALAAVPLNRAAEALEEVREEAVDIEAAEPREISAGGGADGSSRCADMSRPYGEGPAVSGGRCGLSVPASDPPAWVGPSAEPIREEGQG